ncbi:PREDICTED: ubiquitin-conjugating enzyme E2 G1 [Gekko japonicus]|uniref:Ubiquitin-conjugating enzyme E2 G1 n=1 Tax=Gekko japonicus TaxID=146911 RepID=A0ABM1KY89_GEKJA|nr:PREDICTED: ubiquitin-conjugating enzyme E2 G1 [Gekko japonicus]
MEEPPSTSKRAIGTDQSTSKKSTSKIASGTSKATTKKLQRQVPLKPTKATPTPSKKELNKNPVEGFSAGLIDDNDLYRWEVLIIGPPDTLYEGGVFKAHLTFPKDYPLRPPKMKFITEIWHPNVDKNGDVCISILHEPGEDKYGYEKPEERWLPIHTVETIMISVISMLADPNGDSPANVDAAKEWREDRNGEFKRKVARCVRKSQETAFE